MLLIFVASIGLIIISPNLIRLLLGWDGLGLSSYILVIFYQNRVSCNAGILTVLRNRVGDVAILISIGLASSLGSWRFISLKRVHPVIIFLVILAGITKRAQAPFSAWLPAAIAAPTPVSSLVHSSTLVTAGVYLLIRFDALLKNFNYTSLLLGVAVITILLAGINANFEVDLKKVVALSTLSQLGLIISILRIGLPNLAFFHLLTHALFKSTLFMCVGFIIHRIRGYQDGRKIRSLRLCSPFIRAIFIARNLALVGTPFLAGFYSKDVILELMYRDTLNFWLIFMIVLATGITVSYTIRVLFTSFNYTRSLNTVRGVKDAEPQLQKRLLGLFTGRVLGGFLIFWVCVSKRRAIILDLPQKRFTLGVRFIIGLLIGLLIASYADIVGRWWLKWHYSSFGQIWFMPLLRSKPLSLTRVSLAKNQIKLFDLGWFELYGGQGGKITFLKIRNFIQTLQNSVIVIIYLLRVFFLGWILWTTIF